MANVSIVFALRTGFYDYASDSTVLATPILDFFSSPAAAAANVEGINFVEGDVRCFASDGSPLEACFSKTPYIDTVKNTYFAGVYSLRPSAGEQLHAALAHIINQSSSLNTHIIIRICTTDTLAHRHGWADKQRSDADIRQSLKIIPSDMMKHIVFENIAPDAP